MRTIEELRPIIKIIYPNGLHIGHAQPLIRTCCFFLDKEEQIRKHGKAGFCPPAPDTKLWPIPKPALDAGITPEEWAAYAKKAWNEWFDGGPDGTIQTAIGVITPKAHKQLQDTVAKFVKSTCDKYVGVKDERAE